MKSGTSRTGGPDTPTPREDPSDLPDRPGLTPESWHVGNALRDGAPQRGWFIGPFLNPAAGIRASPDLEFKWADARAGDRRAQPVTNETRTTVLILITGKCRIDLNSRSFVLCTPGDYLMWGPDIDHTWEILKDSTILTIRSWPSRQTAYEPDRSDAEPDVPWQIDG